MEGIVSSSSCLGLAVEFELGWGRKKKTSVVDQATAGRNELRGVSFFFPPARDQSGALSLLLATNMHIYSPPRVLPTAGRMKGGSS